MEYLLDTQVWAFIFVLVGASTAAIYYASIRQEAKNHLIEIKAAVGDDFVDMKTAVWVSDRLRWIRQRYGFRYRLSVDVRGDKPSTLHLSG